MSTRSGTSVNDLFCSAIFFSNTEKTVYLVLPRSGNSAHLPPLGPVLCRVSNSGLFVTVPSPLCVVSIHLWMDALTLTLEETLRPQSFLRHCSFLFAIRQMEGSLL